VIMFGIALAAQVERCAPQVAPVTMTALVRVESGGDALAIHDNTTMRSYHPRDRAAAEATAQSLLDLAHSIDVGISQINNVNLSALGLSVRTVFDTCTNLGAGARVLASDYAFAVSRYGPGQVALRHAIGMYNTGRLDAGASYVRKVLLAAGIDEAYDPRPHMIRTIDAMVSPLLVRVANTARPLHSSGPPANVLPTRAPILIRFARSSQVSVF
jgi:type IV secretion system protein VirB1